MNTTLKRPLWLKVAVVTSSATLITLFVIYRVDGLPSLVRRAIPADTTKTAPVTSDSTKGPDSSGTVGVVASPFPTESVSVKVDIHDSAFTIMSSSKSAGIFERRRAVKNMGADSLRSRSDSARPLKDSVLKDSAKR